MIKAIEAAPNGAASIEPFDVRKLRDAGFAITEVDVFYEEGAPKFLAADSLGIARSP